jgi:hypothetical protein
VGRLFLARLAEEALHSQSRLADLPGQVRSWLFIACMLGMVVYLRGVRVPVSLFAPFNLYFMLAMSFLAGMAVTGNWLYQRLP